MQCTFSCLGECDKNRICPLNLRIKNDFNIKSSSRLKLFNTLNDLIPIKGDGNPFWQTYLLSFEIDLQAYLASTYLSNSNTIFNLNNNFNIQYSLLGINDVIPDNLIKFSIVSLEVLPNAFRFYLGGNAPNSYIKTTDFKFKPGSLKRYRKIAGQLFVDGRNKNAKIRLSIDDFSAIFDMSLQYVPGPIDLKTQIFTHPALQKLTLNVFNPRFNYDTQKKYRCWSIQFEI